MVTMDVAAVYRFSVLVSRRADVEGVEWMSLTKKEQSLIWQW